MTKVCCRTVLTIVTVLLCSVASVRAADGADQPNASTKAQIVRAEGAYSLATLTIEGLPKWPANWPLFVPFRGDEGTVSHPVGITRPGGLLKRSGERITGVFEVSLLPTEGKAPTHHAQAKLELTISGGQITGTCVLGDASLPVTGTWRTEAELVAANKLDPKAVWPMWIGPVNGGTCATPTDVQLVDSLADARLVWRSEAAIGNNMGSINRYMRNLASSTAIRTSGQSSSPVYGAGMIFHHQRVPVGDEIELTRGDNAGGGTTAEEIKAAGFEELPWFAKEKYQLKALEQVIAIDAVTGKTVWTSTLPIGARNIQHHKDRGGDRTPAYTNGKLLCPAYNGALFCLDAKTGELLWQNESPGRFDNLALAVAGDVVIAPTKPDNGRNLVWGAYDIATGKLIWKAAQGAGSNSVYIMERGGKHFVLMPTSDQHYGHHGTKGSVTLHCLEAATGQVVWSLPNFLMASKRLGIVTSGEWMVTFEHKPANEDKKDTGAKFTPALICGYRLSDDKAERVWQVEMSVHPDSQPLIMHEGRYAVGLGSGYDKSEDLHKVIDIKTGKVISHATGVGPQNGGYLQAMGDLALVRRDGSHGRIEFTAYRVTKDGQITPLPPETWSPPGPHTTSYHTPAMYPLLDGRIYVRQADGIYCYDLRKTAAASKPEDRK
jgi:outer membrane protein assembly factor BamB